MSHVYARSNPHPPPTHARKHAHTHARLHTNTCTIIIIHSGVPCTHSSQSVFHKLRTLKDMIHYKWKVSVAYIITPVVHGFIYLHVVVYLKVCIWWRLVFTSVVIDTFTVSVSSIFSILKHPECYILEKKDVEIKTEKIHGFSK